MYASGKLLRETYGSNTLDFFYSTSGQPYALKHNGTIYYYITNLQGDVMSIVDASGVVVAEYEYDPYGNIISATGALAEINPLRYRGYIYDSETQLYYLQSRYYNARTGRFLNADSYPSTGQGILGNNMFAYCLNDPVNGCDPCATCFHRWDFWNDCEECGGETIGEKWDNLVSWCDESYKSVKSYLTNTDPQAAIDGKGITFYNGAPVIHLPFECTAFSFGVIVLGSQYKSDPNRTTVLKHEYGHVRQFRKYGLVTYTSTIAIPSVTCNLLDRADWLPWTYFSSPWEYEADQLGGVTRTDYASWASDVNSGYSLFTKVVTAINKSLGLP